MLADAEYIECISSREYALSLLAEVPCVRRSPRNPRIYKYKKFCQSLIHALPERMMEHEKGAVVLLGLRCKVPYGMEDGDFRIGSIEDRGADVFGEVIQQ